MIILKWISEKLFSFLDIFLQNDTGQIGIFGKADEVILQKKNIKTLIGLFYFV